MKNKKQNIFKRVAEHYGTTPDVIRAEIQIAVDAAWEDPTRKESREKMFPEGKPSPELFIQRIAEYARHQRENNLIF